MIRKTLALTTALVVLFSTFVATIGPHTTSAAFTDTAGHPNETAINYVQAQGIVGGYADGSYQPDRILNRAEFTKIIMSARFAKTQIDSCVASSGFYRKSIFSDVEGGVWFEPHTCLAKKRGVIGGFPDGSFKGTQEIIFAEAAKITVNSFGFSVGSGDPWFIPYTTKLKQMGGVPDSLAAIADPIQQGIKPITRGEMAEIIFRLSAVKDEVISDDGQFALRIPESALPSGVKASDIRIRKRQDNGPMQEVNGAPMVFYELEPDGISFREPITFEIETATLQNTVPLVFLASGGDFEMLPNPVIEIDQKTQSASLSGQLSHFSTLGIAFVPLFQLSMANIPNQDAGIPFSPEVTIERTSVPQDFELIGTGSTITIYDSWNLRNGTMRGDVDTFVDATHNSSPARENLSGPSTFVVNDKSFTCKNPNDNASIWYTATLEWDLVHSVNGPTSVSSLIHIKSNSFRCIGSIAPEPTPEPPTESGIDPVLLGCDNVEYLSADQGGVPVEVIKVGPSYTNYCFPITQFSMGTAAESNCDADHWHSANLETVTAIRGVGSNPIMYDSNPDGCGFGAVADIPRGTIYVRPSAETGGSCEAGKEQCIQTNFLGQKYCAYVHTCPFP